MVAGDDVYNADYNIEIRASVEGPDPSLRSEIVRFEDWLTKVRVWDAVMGYKTLGSKSIG